MRKLHQMKDLIKLVIGHNFVWLVKERNENEEMSGKLGNRGSLSSQFGMIYQVVQGISLLWGRI